MRIELLLFLSFMALVIILIACGVPRRPTPLLSSTLFPQLTLSTYDPRLVDNVSMEVDIATIIVPGKVTLPEIDISPPRCFQTIAPQLTCFGHLYNRATTAVADISLLVKQVFGMGTPSAATVFSLEQTRIAAGGWAPYRFQAPDLGSADLALQISLEGAVFASGVDPHLEFEASQAWYERGANIYHLHGEVRNEYDTTAQDIRLIITLSDSDGAIIAYRVVDLPGRLPSDSSRPIDLMLSPLDQAYEIHHRVVVQAVHTE